MKTFLQIIVLSIVTLCINFWASAQGQSCAECLAMMSYAEKLDSAKENDPDKQIQLVNGALELLKKASSSTQLKGKHGEEFIKSILYLMTSNYKYDVHNLSAEVVLELHKKNKAQFNAVIKTLPEQRKELAKSMLGLAKQIDDKGNG